MFANWRQIVDHEKRKVILTRQFNKPKTTAQHDKMVGRMIKKVKLQNKRLQDIGLNYNYPVEWVKKTSF